MSIEQIAEILKLTGYPVAYYMFPKKKAQNPPYIIYYEPGSNNFVADNVVYQPIKQITVELYTETKDPTAETAIETALKNAEIAWNKIETWIDTDNMYQIAYEFEV